MRHVLTITINELRVNFNNPMTLIFLLVLPIIFTVVLGIGLSDTGGETFIAIDVVDQDGGALARQLVEALRSDDILTVCALTGERSAQPEACKLPTETDLGPDALATQRIENETVFAAVVIPAGFSESLLAGEDVRVGYRSSANMQAPAFIRQSVDAAISRVSGAVVAARLSVEAAQTVGALDEDERAQFFTDVYQAAEDAWQTPPAVVEVETTIQEESSSSGGGGFSGFSQSAPGMACMFVMMNVLGIGESLVRARKNWTFQRLSVMPVPRWSLVAGKILAYFIIGFLDFLLIVAVGGLVGVDYGGDILAVVLLALVYTLTVTSMGFAFATLITTLGQATALSNLLGVILAPLGGAWWPLEIVPEAMNIFGHIVSPIAWAMDAFGRMIYYGEGLVGILPYLGVLLLYTAVFFVIGVWRFRYE